MMIDRVATIPLTTMAGAYAAALLMTACGSRGTSPTAPAAASSALTITFDANPVPFSATGCSISIPRGWYTTAHIQETNGVAFTPTTLTQKVDGNPIGSLSESFNSRFGACAGGTFTPGMIPAHGTVCGVVGICTTSTYSSYQFQLDGTDANGHTLSFTSPQLQLGAR